MSFSDDQTTLRVDTAAGLISIEDIGGANKLYLEYDSLLLAEVLAAQTGGTLGDLNHDAMSYLNPWEYSGGDPMRPSNGELAPLGDDARTSSILVRRMSDRSAIAATLRGSVFEVNSWSPDCPSTAQAIGEMRLDYRQSRAGLFSAIRGVQGIPATRLTWKNGLPFVTLQDLRNLYMSVGVHLAEVAVQGAKLDVMRGIYNGFHCQQVILIGLPSQGTVHVGSSGSGGMICITKTEWYEISYDGGATWIPFPVEFRTCSPVAA
ncbi:MAG: hypothetical protein K2R93_20380 [Gemmatimonadaceae bacterium]|nr:hypothetical protein [Gemmatimonadaceae bacterium]